jgi:aldose 1-epimerase
MTEGPALSLFGHAPDGSEIHAVRIASGGTTASFISWGASLQDFRVEGISHSLVLGSDDPAAYFEKMRHFGAVAGPVANRIGKGRASLNGKLLEFERNERGITTLHGGSKGSSVVNWTLDSHDGHSCRFHLQLADGVCGFPGNRTLTANYEIGDDGALTLTLEGQSDQPTFCNLAPHAYWNLDGREDIGRHKLTVHAARYLPVDGEKIPLGTPVPVDGTRFDFRTSRPVQEAGEAPLDHNFCLASSRREDLHPACLLEVPDGVQLEVSTTEPGLQVYDGVGIDTSPFSGHSGKPCLSRAGIAIEPQCWPDAPNHSDYPAITLMPGETSRQISRFAVKRPS